MKPILAAAAIALLFASGAHAKGASEATVEGPGLHGRVVIPGSGEDGGGTPLGSFAQLAGFFPAVFGQVPDATSDTSPATSLGPKYVVRYVVPGPATPAVLVQDVYPYAQPAPVTYMKPLQFVWQGQRTVGGWYLTTTELKIVLEGIGLPADPPSPGGDSWWSGTLLVEIVAAIALAGAVVLAIAGIHKRRHAEPAATA